MARRTKEELVASNYYNWLEDCNSLREEKKGGHKLTLAEKNILRTVPSPGSPYVRTGSEPENVPVKKKAKAAKIDFDKTVKWVEKGNSFLCAVFNTPYTDEMCMLMCERDDCPFHGIGYFRAHGVKF